MAAAELFNTKVPTVIFTLLLDAASTPELCRVGRYKVRTYSLVDACTFSRGKSRKFYYPLSLPTAHA